jgi:tRNA threonylcarbamoyladenosine biosynthesis protein TsaE
LFPEYIFKALIPWKPVVHMDVFEFFSRSPAATLNFGKIIGERLPAGSIIALTGELGCGKTLLTRGICDGLGVPLRQVTSPTFVLVNEYQGRLPVFHMDLYRLDNIDDGFEIGIMDYFKRAESGVMIIEWAEKMLSLLPAGFLKVEFEILGEKKRKVVFSSTGDKYDSVFQGIKK